MFKYIKIAFRNVIANKRRTAFISIAIAIGSIIMIMTGALSTGVRENMMKNAFALFTGHVNIEGIETIRNDEMHRIPDIRPINEVVENELPNSKVLYKTSAFGYVFNPNSSAEPQTAAMWGIDIKKEFLLKESVAVAKCEITPVTLDKDVFENKILTKIKNEETKKLLIDSYLENDGNVYKLTEKAINQNEDEIIEALKKAGYKLSKSDCGDIQSINPDVNDDYKDYAIIDADVAKKFHLKVGDTFSFEGKIKTKDDTLVNKTKDFKVGAIIESIGMGMFFSAFRVSNDAASEFMETDETETGAFTLYLDNKDDSKNAADSVEDHTSSEFIIRQIREPLTKKKIEKGIKAINDFLETDYINTKAVKDYIRSLYRVDDYGDFEYMLSYEKIGKERVREELDKYLNRNQGNGFDLVYDVMNNENSTDDDILEAFKQAFHRDEYLDLLSILEKESEYSGDVEGFRTLLEDDFEGKLTSENYSRVIEILEEDYDRKEFSKTLRYYLTDEGYGKVNPLVENSVKKSQFIDNVINLRNQEIDNEVENKLSIISSVLESDFDKNVIKKSIEKNLKESKKTLEEINKVVAVVDEYTSKKELKISLENALSEILNVNLYEDKRTLNRIMIDLEPEINNKDEFSNIINEKNFHLNNLLGENFDEEQLKDDFEKPTLYKFKSLIDALYEDIDVKVFRDELQNLNFNLNSILNDSYDIQALKGAFRKGLESKANKLLLPIKTNCFKEFAVTVRIKNRSKIDIANVDETQDSIEDRLAEKEDNLQLRVSTWQEEINFLEQMVKTLDMVSYILIGILMFIVLMGISNTLFMSIRERTYEIGTLRAIGMQRSKVLLLFIYEGIILGIFGSIIGIIIGGAISLILTFNGIYIGPSPISVFLVDNTLFFKLTINIILFNLIFVVVIAMLASLWPSIRATKLKPVTAMQRD